METLSKVRDSNGSTPNARGACQKERDFDAPFLVNRLAVLLGKIRDEIHCNITVRSPKNRSWKSKNACLSQRNFSQNSAIPLEREKGKVSARLVRT